MSRIETAQAKTKPTHMKSEQKKKIQDQQGREKQKKKRMAKYHGVARSTTNMLHIKRA